MNISDGFVCKLAEESFASSGYTDDNGYTAGFYSGFNKAIELMESGVIVEMNTAVSKSYDNSDNA